MFEAYVTNLGLYPERGAGAGEYLKFPTTVEEVQALFSRIGIDEKQYEEYFITDYDSDILGLTDHLGEYESLDELNYLAHLLEEMTPDELEKLEAVMDAGEYTNSVKDLINLTQNLDCFDFYSDVNSEEELGRMYIQDFEAMQVPEHLIDYIDYEAYGRDIRINDGGHFAPGGYVADNRSNFVEHYTGLDDIPDEYRISKVHARDEKEETHSILAAIKQFSKVCERLSFTHRDLRIGAGKVVVILRVAHEVIAGRQVLNLRAAARRIAAFACHTVFHLVSHAGDLAVAATLGGGRDTDQAVRRFLCGFADAPRRGYGVGAAVHPFAGLGCDANGVIARVRGGVAGDVHCGGIIAAHGCGMLGAIVGVGSCDTDAGLGRVGRRRRCILLEDCLDLYIAVRHGELVVGDYKSCRRFDLPLLEVIALVGRSAQGDLRTGNSL